MQLNPHYAELNESYLFSTIAHKVADYQKAHPKADVIRLGIGDVTLPLAASVTEAMHKAVEEQGHKGTFHGYIPSEQGYEFLRDAIRRYYAGHGVELDMSEIFISDGAKSDLGNLLDLFSQDNTILVPDPVYPVYVDDNVMAGRKILYLPATAENGFLPMPDEAPHADIVYICSPNNPTGATYSVEQLKAWVAWAKANDAVILFDAAYECFVSEPGLARSIFEVEGAKEVAIEVDERLPPLLAETMAGVDNFKLVLQDVLKVDLKALIAEEFPGMPVAVCANLPYYITSPIVMKLLGDRLPIESLTVMVQKEAADRLAAVPGTRASSAISCAVNYYATSKLMFTAAPGSFYPAPKVTSAVVRMDIRPTPAVQVEDEAGYFALVRAAFGQRRKTAANAIAGGLNLPKEKVIAAIESAGFDARIRPEALTLEDFAKIQQALG